NLKALSLKNSNLALYISEINKQISSTTNIKEIEPLKFILLEFRWDSSSYQQEDQVKLLVKTLHEEYPYNYEFKHSYAHLLQQEEHGLEKALNIYEDCAKTWNSDQVVLHSIISTKYKLANQSIRKKDYSKALEIIKNVRGSIQHRNNILVKIP